MRVKTRRARGSVIEDTSLREHKLVLAGSRRGRRGRLTHVEEVSRRLRGSRPKHVCVACSRQVGRDARPRRLCDEPVQRPLVICVFQSVGPHLVLSASARHSVRRVRRVRRCKASEMGKMSTSRGRAHQSSVAELRPAFFCMRLLQGEMSAALLESGVVAHKRA